MADLFEARIFQFDRPSGYGFVRDPDGGQDVFVHINEFDEADRAVLRDGSLISFEVVDGDRGPKAVHATIVSGGAAIDGDNYRSQLTEALIACDATLTTGQLGHIRDAVIELTHDLGLLDS